MAENVRSLKEILEEMFNGKTSAFEKYAKVRHTKYEIELWKKGGLPLSEVARPAKAYFSQRFLDGGKILEVDEETLQKGLERLSHANNSCRRRCINLANELNKALVLFGSSQVDPESFVDYYTFNYSVPKDENGNPIKEPGYNFEIRHFHDLEIRKWFWRELKPLLKEGLFLDIKNLAKSANRKRKNARPFKE